jgi:hypothetical protein
MPFYTPGHCEVDMVSHCSWDRLFVALCYREGGSSASLAKDPTRGRTIGSNEVTSRSAMRHGSAASGRSSFMVMLLALALGIEVSPP